MDVNFAQSIANGIGAFAGCFIFFAVQDWYTKRRYRKGAAKARNLLNEIDPASGIDVGWSCPCSMPNPQEKSKP